MFVSDEEKVRQGILNRPPPPTPPHLLKKIKVKAIRAFYVERKLVKTGEELEIPGHLAAELRGVKIEILKTD